MTVLGWILKAFYYLMVAVGIIQVIHEILLRHWILVMEWILFSGIMWFLARMVYVRSDQSNQDDH